MRPRGLRLVQVRLTTGLTSEEYVSQKGWVILLPDFLCSRLTGTLAEVKRVVAAVEVAPTQEAASEVLRPDIELPGGVRLARGHGDDAAADLHGRVLVSGRPVPELTVAVRPPRPERSVLLHRHRVTVSRRSGNEAAADLDGGILVRSGPVAELWRLRRTGRCGRGATTIGANSEWRRRTRVKSRLLCKSYSA